MTHDEFAARYDLRAKLRANGVESWDAIRMATQQPVMVHRFVTHARARLLDMVEHLEPAEQARIIERLTVDGVPVIVTEPLESFTTFTEWLQKGVPANVTAVIRPLRPPPGKQAAAREPEVPPADAEVSAARSLTDEFEQPKPAPITEKADAGLTQIFFGDEIGRPRSPARPSAPPSGPADAAPAKKQDLLPDTPRPAEHTEPAAGLTAMFLPSEPSLPPPARSISPEASPKTPAPPSLMPPEASRKTPAPPPAVVQSRPTPPPRPPQQEPSAGLTAVFGDVPPPPLRHDEAPLRASEPRPMDELRGPGAPSAPPPRFRSSTPAPPTQEPPRSREKERPAPASAPNFRDAFVSTPEPTKPPAQPMPTPVLPEPRLGADSRSPFTQIIEPERAVGMRGGPPPKPATVTPPPQTRGPSIVPVVIAGAVLILAVVGVLVFLALKG